MAVPSRWFGMGTAVEAGFEAMNEALKARAEAVAAEGELVA